MEENVEVVKKEKRNADYVEECEEFGKKKYKKENKELMREWPTERLTDKYTKKIIKQEENEDGKWKMKSAIKKITTRRTYE